MLQDIMLRGIVPDPWMLGALAGLVAVYGTTAVVGLRRHHRTRSE
jgi:hypothetical protein